MDNKDRKKILIIIVASIIGAWVAYTVIVTPLWNAWLARRKEIADLQKAVRKEQGLIHRGDDIERQWQDMQTNALPGDLSQAQSAVVKSVDRLAQASRLTTDSISPQVRQDPDDKDPNVTITTVECRMDATGTMDSILNFLYSIGRERMAAKLDSVEIGTKDNTGQQLTLGLTINALVLGAPAPQNNNSGPAPAPSSEQ